MGRGWKIFKVHARDRDAKGDSGEVSGGNESMLLDWSKGHSVIKWQRT